jgi:hypothetical protein
MLDKKLHFYYFDSINIMFSLHQGKKRSTVLITNLARSQNDTATWKALLAGVDTLDAIAQLMPLKIRES